MRRTTVTGPASGRRMEDLGAYGDEVLNASWLPQQDLDLLDEDAADVMLEEDHWEESVPYDIDNLVRTWYLSQE